MTDLVTKQDYLKSDNAELVSLDSSGSSPRSLSSICYHVHNSVASDFPEMYEFLSSLCRAQIGQFSPLAELTTGKLVATVGPSEYHITGEASLRLFRDQATLMHSYVRPLYEQTLSQIRSILCTHNLFVSFTIYPYDVVFKEQNWLLNVVVGSLKADEPGDMFLVKSQLLNRQIHDPRRMYHLFVECMELIWPGQVSANADRVLLFIAPPEAVFRETGNILRTRLFTSIVCLSSIDQTLRTIKMDIKSRFPLVVQFIDSMNYLFTVDSFENAFKTRSNCLCLPPYTFLEAAIYYSLHFEPVREFILKKLFRNNFATKDDVEEYFKICLLISDPSIRGQLETIKNNYKTLASARTIIRRPFTALKQSLDCIERVRTLFSDQLLDPKDQLCANTLNELLSVEHNPAYMTMTQFSRLLTRKMDMPEKAQEEANTEPMLPPFKYAPLAGMDRKRCFPRFESMLQQCKAEHFPLDQSFNWCSVLYCFEEWQQNNESRMLKRKAHKTGTKRTLQN